MRCLLKDAQIYIFDEPYNFLDSHNKRIVQNKIKELNDQKKTVIVISHVLEDDNQFDKILFFKEKGKYAIGSPEEIF